MASAYLYSLTFADGKQYIGVTIRHPSIRVVEHRFRARTKSPQLVYRAWEQHGEPLLRILAIIDARLAKHTEQRAVEVFQTIAPTGYNMMPGGEISPMVMPEIAARVAFSKTGVRHSDATRQRMAESHKGQRHSEATRARMRSAWEIRRKRKANK